MTHISEAAKRLYHRLNSACTCGDYESQVWECKDCTERVGQSAIDEALAARDKQWVEAAFDEEYFGLRKTFNNPEHFKRYRREFSRTLEDKVKHLTIDASIVAAANAQTKEIQRLQKHEESLRQRIAAQAEELERLRKIEAAVKKMRLDQIYDNLKSLTHPTPEDAKE